MDAVEEGLGGGMFGEEREDPGGEVVGGVEGAAVFVPIGACPRRAQGEDGAEAGGEGSTQCFGCVV